MPIIQKVVTTPIGFNMANSHVGVYMGDGGFITKGGALSSDFVLPYFWNMIFVDVTGNVVVELPNGNPFVFYSQQAGSIILVAAKKVLASATIDGTLFTTTPTQLRWGSACNFQEG